MTTLISWKAIDSKKDIMSVYLASDSRFSWGKHKFWDHGQKIYRCINYPEVIGYCGDVLASVSIISSVIGLIDNEIIYKNETNSEEKHQKIFEYISNNFKSFPIHSDTSIVHIIRDMEGKFSYYEMQYKFKNKEWKSEIRNLETSDYLIGAYGSGANYYREQISENVKSDLYETSRFYYMVFCDFLKKSLDIQTGGAPQLVALYKGLNKPQNIGSIWNGIRYFNGIEIKENFDIRNIEWRNENFERYKNTEIKIIEGAKVQPRPKNMKNTLVINSK